MRNHNDQCARCWARNGQPCAIHYPSDMTKRERLIRRLIDSALTSGALVHYMGAYAGAIP